MLLKFAPIMPVFCSLLFPSYYSNNFASKIDASLTTNRFNKYNKFQLPQTETVSVEMFDHQKIQTSFHFSVLL